MDNVAVMHIISNDKINHLSHLKDMFQGSIDQLIIASPYLASDFPTLLSEFSFSKVSQLDLITTFKPLDIEQITKPKTLKSFFDFFKNNYPNIKIKLHVDNHLHGKLYISTNGKRKNAIISSANFTINGLRNNHEWGVQIDDIDAIDRIIEELFESIEFLDVTDVQIRKACMFAEQYEKDNPKWTEKPRVTSDILDVIYSDDNKTNTDPKYYLKPIGHVESPVLLEDQQDFSDLHQNLHFSKKKPKGVRKGDIVITTAVGAGSLLSYFKVTGGLQEATQEEIKKDAWKERWPWYMEGRNQSIQFASQWWRYNIRQQDALSEFMNAYPEIPVTSAGGFGLGTLNFGNDKVQITKEFGDFLIAKISDCSEQ